MQSSQAVCSCARTDSMHLRSTSGGVSYTGVDHADPRVGRVDGAPSVLLQFGAQMEDLEQSGTSSRPASCAH